MPLTVYRVRCCFESVRSAAALGAGYIEIGTKSPHDAGNTMSTAQSKKSIILSFSTVFTVLKYQPRSSSGDQLPLRYIALPSCMAIYSPRL